jgi:hypothetical protein
MTTGIPISSNYFTGLKYNSAFYNTSGGLTYAEALSKFLTFPIAQGAETLASVIVADTLTASKNIIMNGATGASGNYIQFPDLTKQYTATDVTDFASLNTSNTFLSLVSPSQPYQQIITGNSLSSNTNAPLVVKNIDNNEYFGWYIDPSTNFDATMYSAQTTGGLTIRNSAGNSFTMTPSAPNNTAVFSNPISCGTLALTAGAITGTQLTLTSGANTSALTTTSTGLNVADPIVSTGNITGTGLTIATTGNDTYTIDSRSSQGYGLTIINTTSNAKLSLSNGGANLASITCTGVNTLSFLGASLSSGAITTTGEVYAPTFQTGAGGTSVFNNTQVNFNAIQNNGLLTTGSLTLTSGANSTALTTTATGLSVSDDVTAIAQTYNGSLTYGNVLATQGFVDLAISGNIPTLVSGLTLTVANVTLGGTPVPVQASSSPTTTSLGFAFYFTPTKNLSGFIATFNKPYYQGTYSKAQTLVSVCINDTSNFQIGLTVTFTSPTTISFTGFGQTSGSAFPSGVRFYLDYSAIIYTT